MARAKSRKTAETGENRRDGASADQKGAVSPAEPRNPFAAAAARYAAELLADGGQAPPGRDRGGRFTAGAKAGPGRPRKAAPVEPPETGDDPGAHELWLRAMQLRDLDEAWGRIICAYPVEVVRELVAEVLARGARVPDRVIDFVGPLDLERRRSACLSAPPRKAGS